MRTMLTKRLEAFQLTLLRPDSGEGVETCPQLLSVLLGALPEHWDDKLAPIVPLFDSSDPYEAKYQALVSKVRAKVGCSGSENPFRRFKGQQLRVLQGDGVALDTVGDMLASLLANGFCANTVHYGSGGGLLQKLNRDSLAVAFKCCAMYVGGKVFPVGKDPIAGGKKSYGGDPPVMRQDGVLRNRGEYDRDGNMLHAKPKTFEEFTKGVPGDQLVKVFENGVILKEQQWKEIQGRAKITEASLTTAMKKAVDNLTLKLDFLQTMTSDEAIACRLAEASCGSKWKQAHVTHLAEIKATFPKYSAALDRLGVTEQMDSVAMLKHIKDNHVCDKKAKSKIFRALSDDEPSEAMSAKSGKAVITL